jgi:hypothetical protein
MPVTRQIRETRRNLANERQAEYDKLSLKEKIDRLPPEPFAAKQRARLLALLHKPVKVVEVTPEAEAAPIVPAQSAVEKAQAKKMRKAMANAAMSDSTVSNDSNKGSK